MHPLFSTRSTWPTYVLSWTALSIVPALVMGAGPAFGHQVLALLGTWGLALLSLPTYYLCRALPLDSRRLQRVLGIQATVTLLGASFFWLEFVVGARLLAVWPAWSQLPESVSARGLELFGVGIVLSLLALASHYLLLSVEARAWAAERETALLLARQRAELGALRAQVHPHFLFNSLNTVSALIGYDPARAREACVELGSYLRQTLGAGQRPFVSLQAEWDLAETYLGVEALRLGERLQIDRHLEPAALECQVPSLLLQPLIENAITHGVSRASEPSPLSVRAERRGERLLIDIENARVEGAVARRSGGVGLANVRARLAAHYGAEASLTALPTAERFVAHLELPAVRAAEAQP